MPIVSGLPSSTLPSSSPNNNDQVINEVPNTTPEQLVDRDFIRNTLTEKNALSITHSIDTLKCLLGYTSGTPIEVTYFNHNNINGGLKTAATDFDLTLDPTHVSLTQIDNFEIRITNEFTFSYTEDTNISSYVGEAIVYAGFIPIKGDLFLYGLADGSTGLFVIDSIERLSIRNLTHHRVQFKLKSYVTEQVLNKLVELTKHYRVFEKEHFLETRGVYEQDTYRFLKTVEALKRRIAEYYIDTFKGYNNTFSHPETSSYDPFLSRYLRSKISYQDYQVSPRVYATDNYRSFYKQSFWYHLHESDRVGIDCFIHRASTIRSGYTFRSTDPSMLVNREYVIITNTEDDPYYIFSEAFYTHDIENMDAFEIVVYGLVNTNTLDHSAAYDAIVNWEDWDKASQYYRCAIAFEICDYITTELKRGKKL